MKALIDSDIFQWEFGSATDSEYRPIPWPLVQARVQGRIDKIMEETGADSYQLYITSDDKSNFRYDVATIKSYKGNRKTPKPYWYNHIRNFLVDFRGAIEVFGREADDAISIEQYEDWESIWVPEYESPEAFSTIICSRDKDLRMVPGWHYEWGIGGNDSKTFFVTETEGAANFYCQLLTGDPTDNIPGLYGVGKSSKLLQRVRSCSDSNLMFILVRKEYEKRFGSYWRQFLEENARLLWMQRHEYDVWECPEITFKDLVKYYEECRV